MKLALAALLLSASAICAGQSSPAPVPLPSSKVLYTPAPGEPRRTNSLPVSAAVSPDGRWVAVLNQGFGTLESHFGQSISLLDLQSNRLTDYADPRLDRKFRQTYFFGLAWSPSGKELYVSIASLTDSEGHAKGSTGSGVAVYSFADGQLTPARFLKIPPQTLPAEKKYPAKAPIARGSMIAYPAGLAVVPAAEQVPERLLVCGNFSDQVWLLDAQTGGILKGFDVSDPHGEWIPATMPYAVATDGHGKAWVSLWNTAAIAELDLASGAVKRIELAHATGSPTSSAHATALLYNAAAHRLYITLANADEVVTYDTEQGQVAGRINVRLPGQRVGGAYPNALAMGQIGTLYVAEAGTNSVAVMPLNAQGTPLAPAGWVPTEYYPTALAASGGNLVVLSGKGRGTGPNAKAPDPESRNGRRNAGYTYIAELTYGSLARLQESAVAANLAPYTAAVRHNNRMDEPQARVDFRNSGHSANPIHHVIYIIKENRTYDQILGDLGAGDGDPTLAMFGEETTPNHHKLARQFGVLDNFYDSGEISGNGHVWSTAAITSDYTEKIWPINYRNGERVYDFEGAVNGEYPLLQHIADVDEPSTGYLWANAARHGIRYRHYGEFIDTHWCTDAVAPNSPASTGTATGACPRASVKLGEPLPEGVSATPGKPSPWPWAVPLIAENIATKPELIGHFDPHFADFRLEFPDQYRADEFLREFAGFVAAREKGSKQDELPNLVVMRLPNDHTYGARPGMPTPQASLRDNDLALGRVVEAVSHSPYWDDTAIVVLEDDAQNGPDHVDAHRSIALVISKYSPRQPQPFVEHGFYTTVNMVRTIEDLLGLPAMNHNDAQAPPISALFSGQGDQPPYQADRRHENDGSLYEANAADNKGARQSLLLDFSKEDRADANKLNAILWHATMGRRHMPRPRHTVIPAGARDDDD
ncbi:MAG: phosphoesterase [Acidobacteriota bacterium]|nr:phosphoesterase [Acidobacteriota bacterium]